MFLFTEECVKFSETSIFSSSSSSSQSNDTAQKWKLTRSLMLLHELLNNGAFTILIPKIDKTKLQNLRCIYIGLNFPKISSNLTTKIKFHNYSKINQQRTQIQSLNISTISSNECKVSQNGTNSSHNITFLQQNLENKTDNFSCNLSPFNHQSRSWFPEKSKQNDNSDPNYQSGRHSYSQSCSHCEQSKNCP